MSGLLCVLGTGVLVYVAAPSWGTDVLQRAREVVDDLRLLVDDSDPELVAGCLPVLSETAEAACPGTVIIALEGTAVASDFDRNAGLRTAVRPGLRELLLYLGRAGFEVALWAPGVDANAASASVDRLVEDLTLGADRTRWQEFSTHVEREASHVKAKEIALAQKEGRPPRVTMMRETFLDSEKKQMYAGRVLRIVAVLGKQHEVDEGGATGRVLPLHLLRRPLGKLLLIDSSVARAAAFPDNTLLVAPFVGAPASGGAVYDPSLDLIMKLLDYYVSGRKLGAARGASASLTQSSSGAGVGRDPSGVLGESPSLDLASFLKRLRDYSEEAQLRPRTGSPMDSTLGVFALLHRMILSESSSTSSSGVVAGTPPPPASA